LAFDDARADKMVAIDRQGHQTREPRDAASGQKQALTLQWNSCAASTPRTSANGYKLLREI
jgi:hypothetical protein